MLLLSKNQFIFDTAFYLSGSTENEVITQVCMQIFVQNISFTNEVLFLLTANMQSYKISYCKLADLSVMECQKRSVRKSCVFHSF
jgi:hypothetical protein